MIVVISRYQQAVCNDEQGIGYKGCIPLSVTQCNNVGHTDSHSLKKQPIYEQD